MNAHILLLAALALPAFASDKANGPNCERLPQRTGNDFWNLAQCYFQINQTQKSVDVLRGILREDPSNVDAAAISSWLLWMDGRRVGGEFEQRRTEEALEELEKLRRQNPQDWRTLVEIGDFYFLRLGQPDKAYAEYVNAREFLEGDYARKVPQAEPGRRAAIENRIARAAESVGRKGEAVEASCRATFFDPDDKEAFRRIEKLSGSCIRKEVQDPRKLASEPKASASTEAPGKLDDSAMAKPAAQ